MLRATMQPVKPDIKRVVDDLLKEDSTFDRNENRSTHRENLVRAVEVDLNDSDEVIQAFSRNISATGIGIVTSQEVQDRSVGVLQIAGLGSKNVKMLAECRWCREYGSGWFLSGWQFISIKR